MPLSTGSVARADEARRERMAALLERENLERRQRDSERARRLASYVQRAERDRLVREEQRAARAQRVARSVDPRKAAATKKGEYTVEVAPRTFVKYDEKAVMEAKKFLHAQNFGNHAPITNEQIHILCRYAAFHRYHNGAKTQIVEAAKPKAPIGKVKRRIKELDLTPLEE